MFSSIRFPIVACAARLAVLLAIPAACIVTIAAVDHAGDRTPHRLVEPLPQSGADQEAVTLVGPRG